MKSLGQPFLKIALIISTCLKFILLTHTFLNKKGLGKDHELFFAGLFANFYGAEINIPILRFGSLSAMPTEKIEIQREGLQRKLAHLFVVECNSIGGFSGSPVFFEVDRITPDRIFHSPEIYLGGIMKWH